MQVLYLNNPKPCAMMCMDARMRCRQEPETVILSACDKYNSVDQADRFISNPILGKLLSDAAQVSDRRAATSNSGS